MRIRIDKSAADDAAAHRFLDRILAKVEDGWHLWDVSGFEAYQDTTWIGLAGSRQTGLMELYRTAVKRSAWPTTLHGRSLRVTVTPSGKDELSPENAAPFAEEPLVILMENRYSDGCFLRRVLKELAPGLRAYVFDEPPGAPTRLDSIGGSGQMAEVVEQLCNGKHVRPRLVAIVDSDRKYPGASLSGAARTLKQTCAAHDVPCWVLAKRESENYLMFSLLNGRPDAELEHSERLQAWSGLSDDQQDFYDMRNGLEYPAGCTQVEALFAAVSLANRRTLQQGFGPGVGQCWKDWGVKGIKQELCERGRGDLEHGVQLISGEV